MKKDKREKEKKESQKERNRRLLTEGETILAKHPVFRHVCCYAGREGNSRLGKNTSAVVSLKESHNILVNEDMELAPAQWAYVIAHCYLHLAFNHYDTEKMPGYTAMDETGKETRKASCNLKLWNIACDIYIAKFLSDIKLGTPLGNVSVEKFPARVLTDESLIYEYLVENEYPENLNEFGTASPSAMDMWSLDLNGKTFKEATRWSRWDENFAYAIRRAAENTVSMAAGNDDFYHHISRNTAVMVAAEWFMSHYPLLGGLASAFTIIEDGELCRKNEIQVAAVDASVGEIYVNPDAGLTDSQWRFVLAHEYLHAGLQHMERRQGRDPYLWNLATDYVINGWLREMNVGEMPEDALYDPELNGLSAETIYDMIVSDIRVYMKKKTFRGYGKGDMMTPGSIASIDGRSGREGSFGGRKRSGDGVSLDELYRRMLSQGLEYHQNKGRGMLPASLVEEIRAIATPPIPWDVRLAEWFTLHFSSTEKHRSYARPSRRQSCTPDIPRPRFVPVEDESRTFGVIIDTSGSMTAKEIGIALGAVVSYSEERDISYVRLVFSDADSYDCGYVEPGELAGRVEVKGRGGTVLQPAVDLLEKAADFPKNGPILIITDGYIENNLKVSHDHAYLLPQGRHLPFKAKGEVFYYADAG
ncbi:MAG: hypothetical protein IJT96_12160 [Lachnospiraceae bacterium]|nr:hypothetical protein [Lachnospiraceae bacterium]